MSHKEISFADIKIAAEQSSKRKKTFMKHHQDILSPDWTFVSAVATPLSPFPQNKRICDKCRPFILAQDTTSDLKKLEQWLDMVINLAPKQDSKDDHEYANLLTRIIGFLLISPYSPPSYREINLPKAERQQKKERNFEAVCGSNSDGGFSVENTTTEDVEALRNKKHTGVATHLGSIPTLILWNKNQLNVLQRDEKKVLLVSDFGTGKTLLLKARALALREMAQVFFVSLAQLPLQVRFMDSIYSF
jgi:hypothetical protein